MLLFFSRHYFRFSLIVSKLTLGIHKSGPWVAIGPITIGIQLFIPPMCIEDYCDRGESGTWGFLGCLRGGLGANYCRLSHLLLFGSYILFDSLISLIF